MKNRIFAYMWKGRLNGAKVIRVRSWRMALIEDKGQRKTVEFMFTIFDKII